MEQLANYKNYNLSRKDIKKDAFKTLSRKGKQNISKVFL